MSRSKLYPESKVEIQGFIARHYDTLLNIASLGWYKKFITAAIKKMQIEPGEHILDLGCGTGRNARLMRNYFGDNGHLLGMDVSYTMGRQFEHNTRPYKNMEFHSERIDLPFIQEQKFDRVFIGFVLHGFPQQVRKTIIKNAYDNLKPGGIFSVLDFAEFSLDEMPAYYRIPFKILECPYAFDFIEKDWKKKLAEYGFGQFSEHLMFHNYLRLLNGTKAK